MNDRSFKTQRRSVRLKDFDYSSPGAYFVTICTQIREQDWLGEIDRNGMKLNVVGIMVQQELTKLPERFEHLEIDTFVIMPDHVHVIFGLGESRENTVVRQGEHKVHPYNEMSNTRRGEACLHPQQPTVMASNRQHPTGTTPHSIGRIVQTFKSITTNTIIKGVRELGWTPFEKRFWELNYFEHIIRNDHELEQKRDYILENPVRWQVKAGLV
jgi:REP element-mobilizing transposase RayT